MRTSTVVGVLVVLLVIVGLGWWAMTQQTAAPAEVNTNTETPTPATSTPQVPTSAAVTYGQAGFAPAEVTIKKGGTVTWQNQSGGTMWVASAQHPTHMGYSGTSLAQHCDDTADTSFDQCKNAASYSFTFDKTGTWPYHNHSNASHFGRVIVVE